MPGVRPARESDLAAVAGLVRELAEHERAPLRCQPTRGQLRAALFGPEPSLFAHVAETRGEVVGCALWQLDFSPAGGCEAIFVKNLYVQPAHRGRGLGRDLLAALAAEACRRGLARLDWSVARWNMPAIGFYEHLGARPTPDRTGYRLSGESLSALGR